MKDEKIPVVQKELHRWHLMKIVEAGKITLKEDTEKIGAGMEVALGVYQNGQ